MVAVSRNVGRKRALEMPLTGEPIDAQVVSDLHDIIGPIE